MSEALHPNLARIAAEYDLIWARFDVGALDAAAARAEMTNLVTRDDHGVSWRIHADSGNWQRQTLRGLWVDDKPPTWGLATISAHDVVGSTSNAANPDDFVTRRVVDEAATFGGDTLAGATRRAAPDQRGVRKVWGSLSLRARVVAAAAGVALLAFVGAQVAGDADHQQAPQEPVGQHDTLPTLSPMSVPVSPPGD